MARPLQHPVRIGLMGRMVRALFFTFSLMLEFGMSMGGVGRGWVDRGGVTACEYHVRAPGWGGCLDVQLEISVWVGWSDACPFANSAIVLGTPRICGREEPVPPCADGDGWLHRGTAVYDRAQQNIALQCCVASVLFRLDVLVCESMCVSLLCGLVGEMRHVCMLWMYVNRALL